MDIKRNRQLERVLKITKWLENSRNGLTPLQIHDRLRDDGEQVSLRTIYRDLLAIEKIHVNSIKIEECDLDKSKRWKIDSQVKLNLLSKYSEGELIAFYITKYGILPHLVPTAQKALGQTLHLVENVFSSKEYEYLNQLEQFIKFGNSPFPKISFEKQVFYDLLSCMFEESDSEIQTINDQLKIKPLSFTIEDGKIWLEYQSKDKIHKKLEISEIIKCTLINS